MYSAVPHPPSVQHKMATPFQPPKSLGTTSKTSQFNTPLSSTPKVPQFNTYSLYDIELFLSVSLCWTEGFLVWNCGMYGIEGSRCGTEVFLVLNWGIFGLDLRDVLNWGVFDVVPKDFGAWKGVALLCWTEGNPFLEYSKIDVSLEISYLSN